MRTNRKWVYGLTVLVFLAYAAWMLGPYLRSVIVRDAAVTTWSRIAVAPIAGRLDSPLPVVGGRVGEDSHIVTIRNELLFDQAQSLERTRDRMLDAERRLREAREHLGDLEELERERQAEDARRAEVFRDQLENEIANLRRDITISELRLAMLEALAQRQTADAGDGKDTADVPTFDEDRLRLEEMGARHAMLQTELGDALLRKRAAEDGVFITADGGTPEWVRSGVLELELEIHEATHMIHLTEAELEEARHDLALEREAFAALTEAEVKAPTGSLVYSVIASPAATVAAGAPIIEWIDCETLMVDMPVSDAELPLIRQGASAEVVLEGEPRAREATVLLTRGSTATLGRTDLVAIAKGRTPGVAQVLLALEAEPGEFARCPVGRAAFVEFPEVGLIDVLRARLRL